MNDNRITNDLISRKAVYDELFDICNEVKKWAQVANDNTVKNIIEAHKAILIEMKMRIAKLPSVQPERKKGKWIYEGIRGRFPAWRCSVCGSIVNADWAVIQDGANFCPHCGADMRGEQNG